MTVSPGSNDQLDENSAIGYPLPHAKGDPPAHRAVGLPGGSEQAYGGAKAGRQQFFAKLEQVLARVA
jgi:hypothetical protein